VFYFVPLASLLWFLSHIFCSQCRNNTLQVARSSQLQTVVPTLKNKKSAIKTIPSYVT